MRTIALGVARVYLPAMHYATVKERRALGQARRKQVGRQHHGELKPKARTSTALELLDRSAKGRVP
jgi:hypothetical protein